MSNNNNNRGLASLRSAQGAGDKQIKALENKAKAGWRCFFELRRNYEELIDRIQQQRQQMQQQVVNVDNNQDIDLTHLKKLFVEMFEKTGDLCQTDCPVCYEKLNKQNIYIGYCGHFVCNTCKPELNGKCPQCRKQF
jgi:hypothetical protein